MRTQKFMVGSLNCRGDLVDEVWHAFKILRSPSSRTCSLSSVVIAIRIFSAEVLLKMVVSGQDFVVAPFSVPKIGEDQKKRSSLQNKWVFVPKVCENQKKRSLPKNQSVFSLNDDGDDRTKPKN